MRFQADILRRTDRRTHCLYSYVTITRECYSIIFVCRTARFPSSMHSLVLWFWVARPAIRMYYFWWWQGGEWKGQSRWWASWQLPQWMRPGASPWWRIRWVPSRGIRTRPPGSCLVAVGACWSSTTPTPIIISSGPVWGYRRWSRMSVGYLGFAFCY